MDAINWTATLPLVVFFAVMLGLGFLARPREKAFSALNYYLGDRALSGFVLAMTLVATYGSVSSFVSGPGVAWKLGLGWVVFAAPQIIAGFLVLAVLGKKLALVGRRLEALTLIDIIRARFGETGAGGVLWRLCALSLLLFMTAMMVGQLMGGARIFSAVMHVDYTVGLLLFGLVTVLYSALGGFRAVALTDTLCALLMVTGMLLLGGVLIGKAGGWTALTTSLSTLPVNNVEGAFFTYNAGGALSLPLLLSAWVLVGFATVGLPQTALRTMVYEKSQDMRRAMLYASVVCGALMIGVTLLGVLARGVMPTLEGSTDTMMPTLIVSVLDPWWAGALLLGPIAATMSTVSSLLLMAGTALVRDLLQSLRPMDDKTLSARTRWATMGLGVVALVGAMYPLDIVVWVNMFAFGGLEIVFVVALVGGLFVARASALGTLVSIATGLLFYIVVLTWKIPMGGFHAVVPALAITLGLFALSVWLKPERPNDTVKSVFFPHLNV